MKIEHPTTKLTNVYSRLPQLRRCGRHEEKRKPEQ